MKLERKVFLVIFFFNLSLLKFSGEGDEKPKEKEHTREKAVREWKEAIETCQTMSRLHVLMAILDSCIKWEKSAENAVG